MTAYLTWLQPKQCICELLHHSLNSRSVGTVHPYFTEKLLELHTLSATRHSTINNIMR